MKDRQARSVRDKLSATQKQKHERDRANSTNRQRQQEHVKDGLSSMRKRRYQERTQQRKRDKSLSLLRDEQSIENARNMDIFDFVLDFGILC